MSNAGRVLTRPMLAGHVWGPTSTPKAADLAELPQAVAETPERPDVPVTVVRGGKPSCAVGGRAALPTPRV